MDDVQPGDMVAPEDLPDEVKAVHARLNMRQKAIMASIGIMAWLQTEGRDQMSMQLQAVIALLGDVTQQEFNDLGDMHNMLCQTLCPELRENDWDLSKLEGL